MSFGDAIKAGFSNYVVFGGRAARPDYWYFILFTVLVSLGMSVIDLAIGSDFGVFGTLWWLWIK